MSKEFVKYTVHKKIFDTAYTTNSVVKFARQLLYETFGTVVTNKFSAKDYETTTYHYDFGIYNTGIYRNFEIEVAVRDLDRKKLETFFSQARIILETLNRVDIGQSDFYITKERFSK